MLKTGALASVLLIGSAFLAFPVPKAALLVGVALFALASAFVFGRAERENKRGQQEYHPFASR